MASEVIALKSVSTNGEGRRCPYTDGDEEDLHLDDIKNAINLILARIICPVDQHAKSNLPLRPPSMS